LPEDNEQNKEPIGEGLEGLIARKDEALAAKDLHISELEQAISERDDQIATLKQSLAELELKMTELNARLSQAVSSYRALVIKSNPGVPEELVTGESIEAIDKSLADAQNLIGKVRKGLEAEIAGVRVPAGAPQRGTITLCRLIISPKLLLFLSIMETSLL
jgi:uncharacterized coiled-coil protein SlyX